MSVVRSYRREIRRKSLNVASDSRSVGSTMLTTLLLCAVSAAPLAMSSQSGMSVDINTYITQRRHRGSGRPRGGAKQ